MQNSIHTAIADDGIHLTITHMDEILEINLIPRIAVQLVGRLVASQTVEFCAKSTDETDEINDFMIYKLQYNPYVENEDEDENEDFGAAIRVAGDTDLFITDQVALYRLADRLVKMANDADTFNRYAVLTCGTAIAHAGSGSLELIERENVSKLDNVGNRRTAFDGTDLAAIHALTTWLASQSLPPTPKL